MRSLFNILALVFLAMASLIAAAEPQPEPDGTRASPGTDWTDGQRVPGRYIVSFHEPADGAMRKRSHDDLAAGLAKRGVPATILTRFDSPVFYGATVLLDDGADASHATHKRHEEHLRALPQVKTIEAVRIVSVRSDANDAAQAGPDATQANPDADPPTRIVDDDFESVTPDSDLYSNIDLTNIDLSGVDFSDPNFQGIDLATALAGANPDANPDANPNKARGMDTVLVGAEAEMLAHTTDNATSTDATDATDAPDTSGPRRRDTPGGLVIDRADFHHHRTGVSVAHAAGINGTGIKIALLSGGFDYTHPDLGSCFGPHDGCKITFGADLIGDQVYSGIDLPQTPLGECWNTGGTTYAGVLAAQSTRPLYTGVAVGAEIGGYRVLDCKGLTTNEVLIQAATSAEMAGAKIVMYPFSMGQLDRFGLLIEALTGLGLRGILVVTATSKVKDTQLFHMNPVSDDAKVVSVKQAALDVSLGEGEDEGAVVRETAPVIVVRAEYRIDDQPPANVALRPTFDADIVGGEYKVVRAPGEDELPEIICHPDYPIAQQQDDEVLVVPATDCVHAEPVVDKMMAAGVKRILYELDTGIERKNDLAHRMARRIPYRSYINQAVSRTWWAATGSTVRIALHGADRVYDAYTIREKGRLAWATVEGTKSGPTNRLTMHPMLSAPGAHMLVPVPVHRGMYAIATHQGLAAAYAAGCAALLMQAAPEMSADEVVRVLVGSAENLPFINGDFDLDAGLPVSQQGAGVVSLVLPLVDTLAADDRSFGPIWTSVASLSLGDNGTDAELPRVLRVCNNYNASEPVRFNVTRRPRPTVYTKITGDDRSNFIAPETPLLTIEPDRPVGDDGYFTLERQQCSNVRITVVDRYAGFFGTTDYLAIFSGDLVIRTDVGQHKVPYLGANLRMADVVPIDPWSLHLTYDATGGTDLGRDRVPANHIFQVRTMDYSYAPFVQFMLPVIIPPLSLDIYVEREDEGQGEGGGGGRRRTTVAKLRSDVYPDLQIMLTEPITWEGIGYSGFVGEGTYYFVVTMDAGLDPEDYTTIRKHRWELPAFKIQQI